MDEQDKLAVKIITDHLIKATEKTFKEWLPVIKNDSDTRRDKEWRRFKKFLKKHL